MDYNENVGKSSVFSAPLIYIIAIFSILIVIAIACAIFLLNRDAPSPVEITSNDGTFKLTIPGEVEFTRKTTETLDIYSSKDEMILTSSVIQKKEDVNLKDIASLEMAGLYSNKTNLNDVSELSQIAIMDYEAYKYSYIYFDDEYNSDFYTEVIWIATDKYLYVLDLEVITKNQEEYKPIFENIINSFEEITQVTQTN